MGTLKLIAPDGWQIDAEGQSVPPQIGRRPGESHLHRHGAGAVGGRRRLRPTRRSADRISTTQRIEIQYSHLPFILLQPPARLTAVSLDLAIRGHSVGYIAGAGDDTADALRQMGYAVTELRANDLTPDKLRNLDAIVIGIRAFNVNADLAAHLPDIFAYVEAGGTVVAQYNRPDGLKARQDRAVRSGDLRSSA